MNRKNFIKTSLIAGTAVTFLPSYTSITWQNSFSRDQLIGKGNLNIIGESYTSTMHTETAVALTKMKAAALKEDIAIEVVSAYRSFQRQKEIYEGKYSRFIGQGLSPMEAIEKIIEYSTIPGTSRHHWGTDLDLIDSNPKRPESVLQAKNFHGKGPFCKLKEWLDIHAASFGFHEVYTNNAHRKGFAYEPWHMSYAPVSIPMLKAYKKLDVKAILQEEQIKGSEHFTHDFITRYRKENILDINPELLS
ncbi:MAG: M15 family metallopeptidase [Bacteroidetes bacterium]|nr:M15 family metallopeptidase [Bacteroidota bacterium]